MAKSYSILAKKATGILAYAALLAVLVNPADAKIPNDPSYSYQEKMWTQINAPAAWDVSTGSPEVVVAIIDTGADTWHGDLDSNIWTNPYEIPDNGIDDDHNGYVDDTHGWNFVEGNNDVRTSVFDNNDDPEAVRHGTVIAGLIGARGDNSVDGTGINWQIKLMPLRAIESSGSGLLDVVAKAVDYAVDNGANVISMSFVGSDADDALKASLYRAYKKGVVVVTAAGNHNTSNSGDLDQTPTYPACFDKGERENWLLTVGAVNSKDELSRFSDFGSCLDIVAPGEGIFSTERYAPQFGYIKEFGGPWQGTSFATPLVAGAAALLKSIQPGWGPDQIIAELLATVDSVDSVNSTHLGQVGRGRLNIGKAMLAAVQSSAPQTDEAFYYVKGNEINRLYLQSGSHAMIARVGEAEILSSATSGIKGRQTITLLIKRGSFYYIRLLRENGEFLKEFPLNVQTKNKNVVKRAEPLGGDFGRFIVEQFNSKTKATTLSEFDIKGEKVKDFIVKDKFLGWTASLTVPKLDTATIVKKKFSLQEFNWDTGETQNLALPEVTSLDDLKLASVSGPGEQVIALVHQGKAVREIVADLPTSSWRSDDVVTDKTPWKLAILGSGDGSLFNILPFSRRGGIFTVFSGQGKELRQVKLSEF